MKRYLILLVFVLAACSPTFPLITDTREPTPTPTYTPWVVGPVNDTPTPEATATVEATAVCDIKGTAASRIYHMPGQTTYKRTQVIVERGDRWFCSEQEAVDAGFRKAIR